MVNFYWIEWRQLCQFNKSDLCPVITDSEASRVHKNM